MKVKTSELVGPALNWAVAIANKLRVVIGHNHTMTGPEIFDAELLEMGVDGDVRYSPSTDWSRGGPIIERELISVEKWRTQAGWQGFDQQAKFVHSGPTPLIAAMRCYVVSKLGDEIDIPDELI